MGDLKESFKTSLSLFLFLFLMFGLTTNVNAISTVLEQKSFPELSRSWSDISLLYDNHYHNSSQVDEEIIRFQNLVPDLIDIEIIGQSYQGKDLKVLKITNELRNYQKAKTLVVSHHHGREQISIETALRFIIYLLNSYQVDELITEYIDNQEIFVIPMLNPDALDIVVDENLHWLRKNVRPYDDDGDLEFDEDRREDVNGDGKISNFAVYDNSNPSDPVFLYEYFEGIDNDLDGLVNEDFVGYTDLNRNYDAYWRDGEGWSPEPLSDIYPGDTPFSEPETQAFRDFALQHRFGFAYSLHSGINATFFTDNELGWTEPTLYWQMVQDYRKILPHSYTDVYFEPEKKMNPLAESYALAGSWDSWMYKERNTLAPITFELYRNLSAIIPEESEIVIENNATHLIIEWTEIYGYFTPEKEYINALWEDVRPGFDYLLKNTPRLSIVSKFVTKGQYLGDAIEIMLACENLSPRIKTIEKISVFEEDHSIVKNGTMIFAASSYTFNFDTLLPDDIVEKEYVFFVGNEYVGYTPFVIKEKEIRYGLIIGLSVAGLVSIGSSLGIFFLVRRR